MAYLSTQRLGNSLCSVRALPCASCLRPGLFQLGPGLLKLGPDLLSLNAHLVHLGRGLLSLCTCKPSICAQLLQLLGSGPDLLFGLRLGSGQHVLQITHLQTSSGGGSGVRERSGLWTSGNNLQSLART